MYFRRFAGGFALASMLALAMPGSISADETVTYTYYALGRLKVASTDGTPNDGFAYSWCYDEAGNRTLARFDASGIPADCASVVPATTPTSLSIDNAAVFEGGTAKFTVSLSALHASAVSVNYATAPQTADASDFVAKSGTLIFNAGETTKAIIVQTTDDTNHELDETFTLTLSNPAGGATISNGQGTGKIIDNDGTQTWCGQVQCIEDDN